MKTTDRLLLSILSSALLEWAQTTIGNTLWIDQVQEILWLSGLLQAQKTSVLECQANETMNICVN